MKNTTENLVVIEKAKIDWCPRDSSIYRGSENLIDGRMLIAFDPNEDADIVKQLSDDGCNVHQISSEIQVKNKLRLWVRAPIKDYKIPYSVLDKEELVEYFDFEKWDRDHREFVKPILVKNVRNNKTTSARSARTIDELDAILAKAECNNYDVDVVVSIKKVKRNDKVMYNDKEIGICYLRSIRIHKEDK